MLAVYGDEDRTYCGSDGLVSHHDDGGLRAERWRARQSGHDRGASGQVAAPAGKGTGAGCPSVPSWRWCARLFDRLLVTAMTSWGSAGSAAVRHSLSRWLVDTMLYARDLDPHHLEQLGTA
ncbi:hypothetical protein LIA77_01284 [Sarocladium implicatum]|nr:hypothetical protein LIA77_01284 [Sarocladium implicatum]